MKKSSLSTRNILAVGIILVWLWLIIQVGFIIRSLLSQYQLFSVVSGSMEPVLPTGCIIVVRKDNESLYKRGDIITFRDGSEFITHRVTKITYSSGFYYRTQGDANKNPDEKWTSHFDVVGRVVFVAPPFLRPLLQNLHILLFAPPILMLLGIIKKWYLKKRIPAPRHIFRRTQWHITHKS